MRPITKTQKVIKVGNSLAGILDSTFISQTGINPGDQVTIRTTPARPQRLSAKESPEIRYSTGTKRAKEEKEAYLSKEITPEYQKWVQKTLEEDREAMEALAHL